MAASLSTSTGDTTDWPCFSRDVSRPSSIDDSSYLRAALAYVAHETLLRQGLWLTPSDGNGAVMPPALGFARQRRSWPPRGFERAFPSRTIQQSRQLFNRAGRRDSLSSSFDETAIVFGDNNASRGCERAYWNDDVSREIPRSYQALGRPVLRELLACVTRPNVPTAIRRAHVVHGYLLSEIARCLECPPFDDQSIDLRSRPKLRTGAADRKWPAKAMPKLGPDPY